MIMTFDWSLSVKYLKVLVFDHYIKLCIFNYKFFRYVYSSTALSLPLVLTSSKIIIFLIEFWTNNLNLPQLLKYLVIGNKLYT